MVLHVDTTSEGWRDIRLRSWQKPRPAVRETHEKAELINSSMELHQRQVRCQGGAACRGARHMQQGYEVTDAARPETSTVSAPAAIHVVVGRHTWKLFRYTRKTVQDQSPTAFDWQASGCASTCQCVAQECHTAVQRVFRGISPLHQFRNRQLLWATRPILSGGALLPRALGRTPQARTAAIVGGTSDSQQPPICRPRRCAHRLPDDTIRLPAHHHCRPTGRP